MLEEGVRLVVSVKVRTAGQPEQVMSNEHAQLPRRSRPLRVVPGSVLTMLPLFYAWTMGCSGPEPEEDRLAGMQTEAPNEHPQEEAVGPWLFTDSKSFATGFRRVVTEDLVTGTYWQGGQRAGVEVMWVKEGSIPARIGAQQGDVLIAINAHPVRSEAEAIAYLEDTVGRYTVWELTVLRGRNEALLVYHSN